MYVAIYVVNSCLNKIVFLFWLFSDKASSSEVLSMK